MNYDKYMLGVESIDNQHIKLLSLIEDIGMLIKDSMKYDRYDEIAVIVNELERYTVNHFSYEEQLMLNAHYNKQFSHKAKHKFFVDQLKSINVNNVDESQFSFLVSLFDFLSAWLIDHIDKDDREFTLWIKEVS